MRILFMLIFYGNIGLIVGWAIGTALWKLIEAVG